MEKAVTRTLESEGTSLNIRKTKPALFRTTGHQRTLSTAATVYRETHVTLLFIIIIVILFAQIVSIHRRQYNNTVCEQDIYQGHASTDGSLIVIPNIHR